MADEALLIVRGIDERYDGRKHNPWNEVECGDHYARALASWGVLHALAGFTFDGPAGKLGFSPRIQQDGFECFFSAGTGWGNLAQRREGRTQTNRVQVEWGTLRLGELAFEVPSVDVRSVQVAIVDGDGATAPRVLPAQFNQDGARCGVRLDERVEVRAGQRLEVAIAW
jgi:hypothetical protein